jgi:hypothetical protein
MEPKLYMNPVGEPKDVKYDLAERKSSQETLNLGVLNNQKVNATEVLNELTQLLEAKYRLKVSVRHNKMIQSIALPREVIDGFLQKCDVAVVGVGD